MSGTTGTPIHEENQKKMSTTSDVFGNELHRYSIADGIRDGNVLGFDPCQKRTYKDTDLRRSIALEKARASTEEEALADPKKREVYYHYMDHTQVPMAGYWEEDGTYRKGIEDHLPPSQYERIEHQREVVRDILDNWAVLSRGGRFHGLLATSSIPEAIAYYRLFKEAGTALKVTALFDPNIDDHGTGLRYKELFRPGGGGPGGEIPYEIDTYLTEINTGVIDANYMNSRFKKYLKALQDGAETADVLDELHKSFAALDQEEQKYANIFLQDVRGGDVTVEEGKNLRDYITEYMARAKNDQIHRFAKTLGVDEETLRAFLRRKVSPANINEFGRFDQLKATVDMETAKAYFERMEGREIKPFRMPAKIDAILRKFILQSGFDL